MEKRHDVDIYSKLRLGASFFLQEAFFHVHNALQQEYAAILFSLCLEKIDPSDSDNEILQSLNLPDNAVSILQSDLPDVLTKETLDKMTNAWQEALLKAKVGKYKFGVGHKIGSIEILGHLN